MPLTYQLIEEFARDLDTHDSIRRFRKKFYVNPREIYLDGNSLGLLNKNSEQNLQRVISEWKTLAIRGWAEAENPWLNYAEELAKKQETLLGALPGEIILHASTTVNIHALLAGFYAPEGNRNKILMDELTFPSDRYAVEGQLRIKGFDPIKYLKLVKSRDGRFIDEQDIITRMTDDVALIFLPSVLYRSGQLLDIPLLAREAHKRKILIGFDCSHSVGALPHYLSEWQIDFACWCNYKYLNGGPGAAAGLYINRKHFSREPALLGWFGYKKDKQFHMINTFQAAGGAAGWQIGTPHILSLAPLEGSLNIFNEAGIEKIREKSLQMTGYLMYLVDQELADYSFKIGTPRQDKRRGGHIALEHKKARQICKALYNRGIITDFRVPDIIRIAPAALYNSFHELWSLVQELKKIMQSKEYENYNDS